MEKEMVSSKNQTVSAAWVCPLCTLHNRGDRVVCSTCKEGRRTHAAKLEEGADSQRDIIKLPFSKRNGAGLWTCRECTFRNATDAKACSMCYQPGSPVNHSDVDKLIVNAKESFPAAEAAASEASTKNKDKKWACQICTYENVMGRPSCEMCASDPPEELQNLNKEAEKEWEKQQKESEKEREEQFLEAYKKQMEKNIQEVAKMTDENLIIPKEIFECPVCFDDVEVGLGIRLRDCLHDICRPCLSKIVSNDESGDVRCCECNMPIVDRDIKNTVGPELWEKHLQRNLRRGEATLVNSFHCRTPDCNGCVEIVDEVNEFVCEVCQKVNCLVCRVIHEGMTCQAYQDNLKVKAMDNDDAAKLSLKLLEEMLNDGEAMKCPQCEILLQKKRGCDWMMCPMCKLEICWATKGPRWGPKGNGDITGGCQCGVNGKCHPSCRFCH